MNNRYTQRQRQRQLLWQKWLMTPISTDLGVYNSAPRYLVIRTFIERGVLPFVQSKGFLLRGDSKQLTNKYLQYLFALYLGDKVSFHSVDIPKEWLDEFEHQLDSSLYYSFWSKWGMIEDFNDGYAYEAKYTLGFFLLVNLDLQRSPVFLRLQRLQYELEESEKRDPKGKDDPYLQETSRYNYEDRHW